MKVMKKKQLTLENILYIVGLILFIVGLPVALLFVAVADKGIWPPCLFPVIFGLYCPCCGGTRALKSLFEGDILSSFYYLPVVPYTVLLYMVFMFSQTLRIISRGKIKAMKYHNLYLYIATFLIVVNWIVKNILKLVCDISM